MYYIGDTLTDGTTMAKKGKKGFRIPKEIGGVKVPKEARRAGEALIEKACSPEGRQVLASGLAMAATAAAALAARQAGDRAARPADARQSSRPGESATDSDRVSAAIGDAADIFMNRIFGARK